MAKPNGKVPTMADQLIQQTIAQDAPDRPITKGEFQQVEMVLNLMTQQIVGLDIALNMLLKAVARNFDVETDADGQQVMRITPWTEAQHAAFKVEHKQNLEDYRAKIEAAKKNAANKVTLA